MLHKIHYMLHMICSTIWNIFGLVRPCKPFCTKTDCKCQLVGSMQQKLPPSRIRPKSNFLFWQILQDLQKQRRTLDVVLQEACGYANPRSAYLCRPRLAAHVQAEGALSSFGWEVLHCFVRRSHRGNAALLVPSTMGSTRRHGKSEQFFPRTNLFLTSTPGFRKRTYSPEYFLTGIESTTHRFDSIPGGE